MITPFPDTLVPENDAARLRTLHQFQIVNTTPEQIFDDYVAWAAQLFNVPIALVSLVDTEKVWFKATVGLGGMAHLPRNESLCSAAILPDDAVVVSDYKPENCQLIKLDVAKANGLNFYAGAGLTANDGARLGMLAIVAKEFRDLTEVQATMLSRLAGLVSQTIELRYRYLAHGQALEWEDAQRELAKALDENSALARYLTTRNQGIDLSDADVARPIVQRLENVERVLARRLGTV